MNDEKFKDMVIEHDKHIDGMAQSIEHLVSAVGSTNRKLEDVISVIGRQNVLMEKFSNLEVNLKESFSRIHSKITDIESVQNKEGCPQLTRTNEKIEESNSRIRNLEDSQKWVIRTIFGAILTGIIGGIFIMLRQ